jgi:hypothetical protein
MSVPCIYVTADPDATVRAIANTVAPSAPGRNNLLVSCDGSVFYTVLYSALRIRPGCYNGTVTQPALNIDRHEISFSDGEMTYGGRKYVLDETAVIVEVITKPVMQIVSIVETYLGYYIAARNYLTDQSHYYLNGQPLAVVNSVLVRGADDRIEDALYRDHRYIVRGDYMDVESQTATFDGQPATQLEVDDYEVTFPDDLSTVTVKKK